MIFSRRVWLGLALCGALAGVGLVVLSAAGFALGWNQLAGLRHGSNLVPFSFLGGLTLLFLSGGIVLLIAPEILPRNPAVPAILLLAMMAFGFAGLYVKHVKPLILLPVDIAMGSESQFVDQIIRHRAGQPQYTPAEDANSTAYAPGAPMVTYWIASLLGRSTSIATYRAIQQLFILLAVFLTAAAARLLLRHLQPENPNTNLWLLFWVPFLYLMATNPYTNVYAHVLYSDGLGLAANSIAMWLLFKHLTSQDDRWLIPMAVIPALGFLVKQKEAIWLGLYVLYFLLAGRIPLRRIIVFAVSGAVLLGLATGMCYALWGAPFWFWNFQALSRLHVSLSKLLEQVQDGGIFLLPGLIGGGLLLRGEGMKRLFSAWVCWLVHAMVSIYTSGIAFRPAHLGAATMFGTVWFLVGLAALWPAKQETGLPEDRATSWWLTAMVPLALFLFMLRCDLLRLGPAVPEGFNRYVADIEKEFADLPRDKVLLETGSWVYLPTNTVMKDRESPIGTLWGTGASDYQATLDRFRDHYYARILARKEMFFYRDDRIRITLLQYYDEVRTIPSPGVPKAGWLYRALLSEVAVLEPKKPPAPGLIAPPAASGAAGSSGKR
jgi:hypothetical protein